MFLILNIWEKRKTKKRNIIPALFFSTMFTFNIMDVKPEKGMYKLQISASLKSPDPRVISNIGATMAVKVMCTAAIDFIDIGTADADQTTLPKMER